MSDSFNINSGPELVLILRKSLFLNYLTLFDFEMTLNITQTKKYFTTRSVLIFLYI